MVLKIKRVRPDAPIPGRATSGSAGMDLRAYCEAGGITLAPLARVLVPTGIAVEFPNKNVMGLVFARSGLAIHDGLALANGVGVIDSDYRGEISVPLINLSDAPVHISNGQRIAQLAIVPVILPDMIEIDELSDTERGEGGFGSTGTE